MPPRMKKPRPSSMVNRSNRVKTCRTRICLSPPTPFFPGNGRSMPAGRGKGGKQAGRGGSLRCAVQVKAARLRSGACRPRGGKRGGRMEERGIAGGAKGGGKMVRRGGWSRTAWQGRSGFVLARAYHHASFHMALFLAMAQLAVFHAVQHDGKVVVFRVRIELFPA